MSDSDYFGSAKETLRENVKLLATSFAGMAAILLAGAPFTGFGGLSLKSGRFWFAFITLLAGGVLIFIIWQRLLQILRPDTTYTRFLRENRTADDTAIWNGLSKDEKAEYEAIKKDFDLYKDEFLPERADDYSHDFEGLEKRVRAYWARYTEEARKPEAERDTAAQDRWIQFQEAKKRIRDWASYRRLHHRVTNGIWGLKYYAGGLLLCLAAFAYAVSPGKSGEGSATPATVMVDQSYGGTALPDLPSLESVTFPTRQYALDAAGRKIVGRARDYLRTAPEAGLLLVAHTDTVGDRAFNIDLAGKRAQAVKNALIEEGGIAATRLYIAELPETDLPVVTGQEADEAANRSVELLAFRIPKR